jgi:hypothetical protein
MGPQDNGPRDGDFVRYIDELTARVAAKAAAKPASNISPTPTSKPATTLPTVKPSQAQPSLPPWSLEFGALFTIGLFFVGGLLFIVGVLATGLDILIALGFGLLAWAARRTADARKAKA